MMTTLELMLLLLKMVFLRNGTKTPYCTEMETYYLKKNPKTTTTGIEKAEPFFFYYYYRKF